MREVPSPSAAVPEASASGIRRRALPVVLTLSMGLGAFPMVTVSALSPYVVNDLGIGRAAFGAIPTVMFVTAIAASIVVGRTVDRFGPRAVLAALHLIAATAVALFATASTWGRLLLGGAIIGLAQAASNPATNAVIARWIPAKDAGAVVGLKQSGVPLIQFAAGAALAPLAAVIGWRAALLAGSVVILPSLLATLLSVPAGTSDRPAPGGARAGMPVELRWLFVATFLVAMAHQAGNIYLPLYAFEVGGASASTAGVLGGTVGLVGMVARILVGRRMGRDPSPVRVAVLIAAIAALAALGLLLAPRMGPAVLWVTALLFGASAFSFNVVGMTVVLRSVERGQVGRASGAVATAFFLGFAAGPLVFGSLVDRTGSYASAWSFVAAACVVATLVGLREMSRSVRPAVSSRGMA